MKNNKEKIDINDTFYRNPRNTRWIRSEQINSEVFQTLLKKIIGPNKSMSEFARNCGVSTSSISRLLNGQAKEPSCQMLFTLLDNADPESGVTAEMLFKASGLSPQKKFSDFMDEKRAAQRIVKMILFTAQIDQGHTVKEAGIERKRLKYAKLPDIVIETDAFDGIWEFNVINFDFKRTNYDSYNANGAAKIDIRNKVMMAQRDFIQILGRIYLESTQNIVAKYTLVFKDKDVYDWIVNEFSETVFYDNISFMLIDTDKGVITSEHILKQK
jgi:transcriptional regulator with XRE-family HTH domain